MKLSEWLITIVACVMLGMLAGAYVGVNKGKEFCQAEAVKKGFAHYEVTTKKKVHFVWNNKP